MPAGTAGAAGQGEAAVAAEALARRVHRPAVGARRGQRSTAVSAEALFRRVVGTTSGAGHESFSGSRVFEG